MLDFLKTIGKGTTYEFCKHALFTPLPKRNSKNMIPLKKVIDNAWYDKSDIYYKLVNNVLYIVANNYFPNEGFSIVDYINKIPENSGLTIMLKIKSKSNETSGFNMLCNLLSTNVTTQKIIIDITEMEFCEKVSLDIDALPNNVKITSLIDHNLNENYIFSNQSFESWSMNTNDKNFELLLSKLTVKTRERIIRMREICSNFYRFLSNDIRNASNREKALFAYNWCCSNIKYDNSATNEDGYLKNERKDSQDPIITFDNKMGVCEGRARLFKLLLNNNYMNVPCFLVKGTVKERGRILPHTWNEIVLEDGTIIDLDISKQRNRTANNHDELIAFNNVPVKSKITFKKV